MRNDQKISLGFSCLFSKLYKKVFYFVIVHVRVPEWSNGMDSRQLSDECSYECDETTISKSSIGLVPTQVRTLPRTFFT